VINGTGGFCPKLIFTFSVDLQKALSKVVFCFSFFATQHRRESAFIGGCILAVSSSVPGLRPRELCIDNKMGQHGFPHIAPSTL